MTTGPAALGRAQHASVLRLRPVERGGQKGTQSNWREKQARICVLCDAFCSHTAPPRVKGVHQPRDSAVFVSKRTITAAAAAAANNNRNNPPLSHRSTMDSERAQAVKGRRGESSSTQSTAFELCSSPQLRPPVHHRCRVFGLLRLGLTAAHAAAKDATCSTVVLLANLSRLPHCRSTEAGALVWWASLC